MQWIPCITIYAASHPDSFNDVAVPNLTQFLNPSQRLKVELYLPRQDTPTIIQAATSSHRYGKSKARDGYLELELDTYLAVSRKPSRTQSWKAHSAFVRCTNKFSGIT